MGTTFVIPQALTQNLVSQVNVGESQPSVLTVNPQGHQLVSQALPERVDIVRKGNSQVIVTAAVACVTAVPSTTAPAHIWNGEQQGGKIYVVDRIVWTCSTSAGAASMFSIVALVPKAPVTSNPATADTMTANGLAGQAYLGQAAIGHSATVVNDNWFAIGPTFHSGALTATVGAQVDVPVNGLIVVPPGHLLCLACIAANGTAAGKFSVYMHEVQTPVAS